MSLERARALGDFYWFCKYVFGWKDLQPHVHRELCDTLQTLDTLKGEGEGAAEALILMPRGSFKSSVGAQAFPLWYLLNNPDARILISSATAALAHSNMIAIRSVIEENTFFKNLFGDLVARDERGKPIRWNQDEILTSGRSEFGRQLMTASITVGAVGKIKTGQHFDVNILDDIVNHENSATIEQNKKVLRYYGQAQSLLEPDGIQVDIGTRYKYDDLYGYLTGQNDEKKIIPDRVICEKAIRDDGTLFFPERHTRAFLDGIKAKQGPYMFSCQYQNEPTDEENAIFLKEDFEYYDELPPFRTKFLMVDPSRGESAKSDFSACVVVSVDAEENYYIELADQRRAKPSQLIDWIYDLHRCYKFDRICVEQVGMQTLVDMIQERFKTGSEFIPVQAAKNTTSVSKMMRIRAMEPYFKAGKVKLRRGMQELEDQLIRFPNILKDDLVDALSMFVRHSYSPNKPKQEEDKFSPREPRASTKIRNNSWTKKKHYLRWSN